MPLAWQSCLIAEDTSVLTSSAFGLCEINDMTGATTRIESQTDRLLAQSPDHRHFLLLANSTFSPSSALVQMLQLIRVELEIHIATHSHEQGYYSP